jgi:phosphoglycolate phosphatase
MDERPRPHALSVQGVVFDLDGTLVDGYVGIASGVNAARAAFQLPALSLDDIRGRVGRGLSHLMEDVVGPERAAEGQEIFVSVYERVCEAETVPMPQLALTLEAIAARGVRMSVASNKPATYSIRILARLGVRSWFDTVEGPDTAGALKPDPAMIAACLRAMKVARERAIYVGDMAIDAEAGSRAGVDVVLVSGGSSAKDELRATGCPVIGALKDLLERLP